MLLYCISLYCIVGVNYLGVPEDSKSVRVVHCISLYCTVGLSGCTLRQQRRMRTRWFTVLICIEFRS